MLPTITYEFEPRDGDSRSTRFTRNVEIAPTGKVGIVSIKGMEWGEVDFLNDVEVGERLTANWN